MFKASNTIAESVIINNKTIYIDLEIDFGNFSTYEEASKIAMFAKFVFHRKGIKFI